MSIDVLRGGTLRYPRVGAGDSLCGRGGVDAREASRRGVGFLFVFATANVYVQLGVKMIVFQGVLMVSPAPHAARASLSCGFQGVSSVTAPTARASSFGFQIPCDSTMRWRTGTSAGASSTAGPRGRDERQYPYRRPYISRRRSVCRRSPKRKGKARSTYDPR